MLTNVHILIPWDLGRSITIRHPQLCATTAVKSQLLYSVHTNLQLIWFSPGLNIVRTKGSPSHEAKGGAIPENKGTLIAPHTTTAVARRHGQTACRRIGKRPLSPFPRQTAWRSLFLVRLTSPKHSQSFAVLILDAV